jgi:hypothetical protein
MRVSAKVDYAVRAGADLAPHAGLDRERSILAITDVYGLT